jgi:excisionase family DNA binding protein
MRRLYILLEEIRLLLHKQYILQKEFLTLEEAAEYLGMSRSNLYKLTSREAIPFHKPGGKLIVFDKTELRNWLVSTPKPGTDDS